MAPLTTDGASKMAWYFNDWFPAPGDWDVLLRQAAEVDDSFRDTIQAGYTYPSIGHFGEHPALTSAEK